jgi:N-dimethylarginine dimethylaminohydrolase
VTTPDPTFLRPTAEVLNPAGIPTVRHPLHSFDEFTRLRAIVVGVPQGANHPEIDASFENFFRVPDDAALRASATGPVPKLVIDEIEEDIAGFTKALTDFGVEVIRPVPVDSSVLFRTPYFQSTQLYSLMPRDTVMVVGDLFVEVPSPTRARFFETYAFRPFMEAYQAKGAHAVAAPKPILGPETYQPGVGSGITEAEILFDAANCIRVGKDIFIDVNHSANRRAVGWLERTLRGLVDDAIRVHPMSLGYDHVDVTLVPLRPGVVLIDPVKVTEKTIPHQFRNWDKVVVDEVMPTRDYGLPYPLASNDGIGRNVLVLDPQTVVVDEIQLPLIRALEKRRFTVIPLPYRHGRTLGGSWHCITLDTHRDGGLTDYFA